MKLRLLLICLFAIGCARTQTRQVTDTAPFKAVVVFEWLGEASSSDAESEDDPIDRSWVEDEILAGLQEAQVFSDLTDAEWRNMNQVALDDHADLIVLIRIGALARTNGDAVRVVPRMAALDTALWFGTAIGGWWVPGREFPTRSDVQVSWKRPRPGSTEPSPSPQSLSAIRAEFPLQERLTTGDYRLSLWDRAKFWSYPQAYLVNIVVPSSFIPIEDPDEVRESLTRAALADIQEQLTQKLTGQNVRAAGAAYFFRLEEPANGQVLEEGSAKLRFRYRVESGFSEYAREGLSALRIDLKREGQSDFESVKLYSGEAIKNINQRIANDEELEETVDGLGPGINLVRFSARTTLGDQWITNTIALRAP